VRGQALTLRETQFVEAARVIGARPWWIIRTHLLPNSLGLIIVYASLAIPGYILGAAALDYLGIGMSSSYPTWGTMIAEAQALINDSPHVLWVPTTCLVLVTAAFYVLGDGLRDALDPRTQ
jgi:ABC-type dipeptide/oligopeptide/nickel transport system permease subunit